jgi:hypothetical protein
MTQLINKKAIQTEKVTARFTESELEQVKKRAEEQGMNPSAFARQAILTSLRSTPTERLLLAKLCKVESLTQSFFRGLFGQLNQQKTFDVEAFKAALEKADSSQYHKADKLLELHASLRREENGQNGATNHA